MNVLLLVVALAVPVEAPKAALPEVAAASAAVAPATDVREAVSVSGCSLLELPPVKRFLSAPWCAARRLKAARLHGDTDEVRRMEALFGDLLAEAVGVEGN